MSDPVQPAKCSHIPHDTAGLPSFELYCEAVRDSLTDQQLADLPSIPKGLLTAAEEHDARRNAALLRVLAEGVTNLAIAQVGLSTADTLLSAFVLRVADLLQAKQATNNLMHRL